MEVFGTVGDLWDRNHGLGREIGVGLGTDRVSVGSDMPPWIISYSIPNLLRTIYGESLPEILQGLQLNVDEKALERLGEVEDGD